MDKIFIGTPVRDIKEYAIDRFLASTEGLIADYILCLVDNSDTEDFFTSLVYKTSHRPDIEIFHLSGMAGKSDDERLVVSRELLRSRFLQSGLDLFLSWECDVILPEDAFVSIYPLMDYIDVVCHEYPDRTNQKEWMIAMGFSCYKRRVLEKIDFTGYGNCNPKRPDCVYSPDSYFTTKVLEAGFYQADVRRLVKGIQHLNE
jgi:hypothetical protein